MQAEALLHACPECTPYAGPECGYYETMPLFVINSFLAGSETGRLIHVDGRDNSFMIMTVEKIS